MYCRYQPYHASSCSPRYPILIGRYTQTFSQAIKFLITDFLTNFLILVSFVIMEGIRHNKSNKNRFLKITEKKKRSRGAFLATAKHHKIVFIPAERPLQPFNGDTFMKINQLNDKYLNYFPAMQTFIFEQKLLMQSRVMLTGWLDGNRTAEEFAALRATKQTTTYLSERPSEFINPNNRNSLSIFILHSQIYPTLNPSNAPTGFCNTIIFAG